MFPPPPPFVFSNQFIEENHDESFRLIELLSKLNQVMMSGNMKIGGHKICTIVAKTQIPVSEIASIDSVKSYFSAKVVWYAGVVHAPCTRYLVMWMKIFSPAVGR